MVRLRGKQFHLAVAVFLLSTVKLSSISGEPIEAAHGEKSKRSTAPSVAENHETEELASDFDISPDTQLETETGLEDMYAEGPRDAKEVYALDNAINSEDESEGPSDKESGDGNESKALIKKRHLASMAKQGHAAARKISIFNSDFGFDDPDIQKRYLGSMARQGDAAARKIHLLNSDYGSNAALFPKRNLASMARQGDEVARRIQVPAPSSGSDGLFAKRNLASMARQGDEAARRIQVLVPDYGSDDLFAKRNLASMARQGDEAARRIQVLVPDYGSDGLFAKRNLASMARQGDEAARRIQILVPDYGADGLFAKRNLASMARQGDEAARRIQVLAVPDYGSDNLFQKRNLASMARQGDEAARRIQALDPDYGSNGLFAKRNLASMARQGDDVARRIQVPAPAGSGTDALFQKRSLESMARQGDAAARRIHSLYQGYEVGDDDDTDDEDQYEEAKEKRYLGALARDDELPKLRSPTKGNRFQASTRESDVEGPYRFPERRISSSSEDNGLESDYFDGMEDAAGGLHAVTKKHIGAVARKGKLTNLRIQRRPTPWIGEEEDSHDNDDYDGIRSNDGYKRNIQTLARIAAPGSGLRTWLYGGQPWSLLANKRRPFGGFGRYGGGSFLEHYGMGGDRGRGVRSTKDGSLSLSDFAIPPRSPALLSHRSDNFRSPMVFAARHMWKRATGVAVRGERLHARHRQKSGEAKKLLQSPTVMPSTSGGTTTTASTNALLKSSTLEMKSARQATHQNVARVPKP